jgi:hypothetical protein
VLPVAHVLIVLALQSRIPHTFSETNTTNEQPGP